MDKFDTKSARMVSIVIFICLIFTLVVWQAFKYLPENSGNININNSVIVPTDEEESEPEEDSAASEEETIDEDNEILEEPKDKSIEKLAPLENIDEESDLSETPLKNLTKEERFENAFKDGDAEFKDKQYAKALVSYKNAADFSPSPADKANCYEKIANIYAIVKRYGSALSFAQQAYNTDPTTAREVLLARLYYKTGDIDKATKRINNVLQREFSADK